jgi:hypothetical protein
MKCQKARKSDNNNCKNFYGGEFSIYFEKKKVVNFKNKVKLIQRIKIPLAMSKVSILLNIDLK